MPKSWLVCPPNHSTLHQIHPRTLPQRFSVWRNRKGEATVVRRMKLSTAGWPRPCLGWTNTNSRSLTNTNNSSNTNTNGRFLTNTDSRFLKNTDSRFLTDTNSRSLQILTADFSQILTADISELLTADFSEIHFNGRFHIWAFGYDTNQASCCLFDLRTLLSKKKLPLPFNTIYQQ